MFKKAIKVLINELTENESIIQCLDITVESEGNKKDIKRQKKLEKKSRDIMMAIDLKLGANLGLQVEV